MKASAALRSAAWPALLIALAAAASLVAAIAGSAAAVSPAAATASPRFPGILLITVDTLRADRLSAYGYRRSTSPRIDALMAAGARFTAARTPEPLTAPAMASVLTALDPHEHGCTRNGLPVRPNLPSFPKALARAGYATAAFVGNWTLRDRICGLGEHFGNYQEVFSRRRWIVAKREASAEDLNAAALAWLAEHSAAHPGQPFLLWIHYVEPHAPYLLQAELLEQLGLTRQSASDSSSHRYDTEVAFVDRAVGELVERAEELAGNDLLVAFAADHGESLGEHGDWGHGRNLYEPGLRVPLSLTWRGTIRPAILEAPALLTDLAATLLGLASVAGPQPMRGFDWSAVLRGEASPPTDRVTYYQAHRGAVTSADERSHEDRRRLRRRGLLEVGRLVGREKEVWVVADGERRVFDLTTDPAEQKNLPTNGSPVSPDLAAWLAEVERGLGAADTDPPPSLDAEDVEALKALGYID